MQKKESSRAPIQAPFPVISFSSPSFSSFLDNCISEKSLLNSLSMTSRLFGHAAAYAPAEDYQKVLHILNVSTPFSIRKRSCWKSLQKVTKRAVISLVSVWSRRQLIKACSSRFAVVVKVLFCLESIQLLKCRTPFHYFQLATSSHMCVEQKHEMVYTQANLFVLIQFSFPMLFFCLPVTNINIIRFAKHQSHTQVALHSVETKVKERMFCKYKEKMIHFLLF